MRWSYVGDLGKEGPLDWGGTNSGNIPVTERYLPNFQDNRLYLTISWHAKQGNYDGRAVDWGAQAIKVDGPKMLEILEECYGALDQHSPQSEIGLYADFARNLPSGKHVALIAASM